MPGAELQLAAYGVQDLHLTGNPQMSFFVTVFRRHTFFAIENIEEVLHGEAMFGGKSYVKLGRYGDLVGRIYLEVKLAGFNPDADPSYAISWVNAIGHAMIKRTYITIGGIVIDTQYGTWMEIWNELTLPEEKKWGYYDMIGKHDYFNVTMQQGPLKLRIPLQFWFNRNSGLYLPAIALQHAEIFLFIEFSNFDELYVSSTGDLTPVILSGQNLTQTKQRFQIIEALCYVDYIYLDDEERRWFVNTPHQYLIEQVQRNHISTDLTSINNVIQLEFNHPVKELIWVIRDCLNFQKVSGGGNDWFNFAKYPSWFCQPPTDPMEEAIIYFEGQYRFYPPRKARYFREVEPYKYHSNVPDNFIYVYSFALYPELHQPSGTCDFSVLDNVQLNVKIVDGMYDPQIIIFATNYNLLIIRNGFAGLRYAN